MVWQHKEQTMSDINIGQISEALNDKADRDLMNVDTASKADAVVDYQEPTSANNYTWYRKYASGWVEQGGFIDGGSGGWTTATITYPINMDSTNYQLFCQGNWSDPVSSSCQITAKTTNSATIIHANNSSDVQKTAWSVYGMAA